MESIIHSSSSKLYGFPQEGHVLCLYALKLAPQEGHMNFETEKLRLLFLEIFFLMLIWNILSLSETFPLRSLSTLVYTSPET